MDSTREAKNKTSDQQNSKVTSFPICLLNRCCENLLHLHSENAEITAPTEKNVQTFSNGKNVTITDRLCRSCQSIANALSPGALRAPLAECSNQSSNFNPISLLLVAAWLLFPTWDSVISTLEPKLHPSFPMELLCA